MIKKIIVSLCLLLSLVSFAQDGTASPYSFYGIGDVRFKGTHEIRSMAGIAIEQDSIHINLQNPASYASLKLSTFTLGGTYATSKLKDEKNAANTKRSTLDYLAVGLPLGKFGVGFGLIPYSSVGYKIRKIGLADQNNQSFNGTGGLNKAFIGVGYKITPQLSIGADANYNFGKIETSNFEYITGIATGTRELNDVDLSGVNFNAGLMYQTKIYKKVSFFSSLNYSIESTLNSKNTRNISTALYNSNFDLSIVDVLQDIKEEKKLEVPSKYALGAGVGEAQKWLVGIGYSFQKAASLSNTYNSLANVTYEKNAKYSIGGYYIPNYNSFSSYAQRVTYRGGFRYENTGLVINAEPINDMALTLGFGLPLSGTFSNVNIGFELGKKGTTTANLVEENYANLSISLSLNEQWFIKRKFN
jgi:long-subunit fatty acid transport protein